MLNYPKKVVRKVFPGLFLAKTPKVYPEDVFIASYPKSGNTWTRFVLAHLLTRNTKDLNFQNYDQYVPELGVHDEFIINRPPPRLMKTHVHPQDYMNKAVYVIRDPRDVYVSYYYYLRKRYYSEELTFEEFFLNSEIPFGRWKEHVEAWDKHQNKIVIRYEDLLANPEGEFQRLIDFVPEFELRIEDLPEALNQSSFDRLKQKEKAFGRAFRSKEDEKRANRFMRKGVKGDWKSMFTPFMLDQLYEKSEAMMSKYGYSR
ncbi:MAG: sulfotransferase domain-containing protein [Bacteroidota bacterium]